MKTILLCSDLDRTLIPNGAAPESPQARPAFAHLTAHSKIRLAYVSGRDKDLVKQAMAEFDLPDPDYVVGDVGTTLYRVLGGRWLPDDAWQDKIGRDWGCYDHDAIRALLADLENGRFILQDAGQQGRYKVSYFTAPDDDPQALKADVAARLDARGIAANLIWSRDEAPPRGLLDILPRQANKLQAIRFLMQAEGLDERRVVFAGDSGNDLDALTSGLPAILVNNAADDVRRAALDHLSRRGLRDRLYAARGAWGGMNGNYAAGVVEGVVHFFPDTAGWLKSILP